VAVEESTEETVTDPLEDPEVVGPEEAVAESIEVPVEV
jgi:hypothetical protein